MSFQRWRGRMELVDIFAHCFSRLATRVNNVLHAANHSPMVAEHE